MPTDMRYIFDTNVIVSALLLKNSVVRQAFDRREFLQYAYESAK